MVRGRLAPPNWRGNCGAQHLAPFQGAVTCLLKQHLAAQVYGWQFAAGQRPLRHPHTQGEEFQSTFCVLGSAPPGAPQRQAAHGAGGLWLRAPLISACIVALQSGGRLLWMAEIHVSDMLWRYEAHTYTMCKASRKKFVFFI